ARNESSLPVRACRDRALHQLPASLRQGPYAAPRQIPQAFVSVARINEDDAFACGRVIKRGTGMFRYKLKELLPPRSIRTIKHLFSKLLQFFNADNSDRFRNGFPSIFVDGYSVLEFIEWHRIPYPRESKLSRLYASQWTRAKTNKRIVVLISKK